MKPNNDERNLFTTETSLSDSGSWLTSLMNQLKEARRKPDNSQPTAGITAKPIPVEEIWSRQDRRLPGLLSLAVHIAVAGLLLVPWAASLQVPQLNVTSVQLYTPASPLILNLPLQNQAAGGGGGGGMRTPTPASLGNLPRAADKQLAPPTPEVRNQDPLLIVEPTIVAPQLTKPLTLALFQMGDPDGIAGPPSAGPGFGGGIGNGEGRGAGSGDGPGFDDGSGGGAGDKVFSVGGGVTKPMLIKQVDPEYSDAARRAKYQGILLLETIVRRDGTVDVRRVIRGLGYGLDESAIAAVKQWRFRPAMANGQAVDAWLQVEVRFSLL